MLTQARLKELLSYDPDTGHFAWRTKHGKVRPGDVAGCPDKRGYLLIGIDRKLYKAHRLAWLYVYGAWPTKALDHIDGCTAHNAIANLREVTQSENMQNIAARKNSVSGHKGVSWDKARKAWVARIKIAYAPRHLGRFACVDEAIAAYKAAAAIFHTHNPAA